MTRYIRTFAICSLFLLLALYFFHPIPLQGTNVDLGHHLLLGKITVEQKSAPQTNLISFTHPTYVFVNNQWLSEVVFYTVHKSLNFNGLILLSVLLMLSSFLLLFLRVNKRELLFPALLTGAFYFQMLIDRTEVKPELFSFLFLCIFLHILYRYRERKTNWIFLLPLLQIFWVNFHIFFVVGIAVVSMFVIETQLFSTQIKASQKNKTLLLILCFVILASCINPNFIKGAIYPFYVLTNYGYEVIENLNIFSAIAKSYADITFFYFLTSVLFLWIGIIAFYKKIDKIDILLSTLFTFLGFFAVRNFPLFALGTFIPMVHIFHLAIRSLEKKYHKQTAQSIKIYTSILILFICMPGVIKNFELHGIGLGVIDNADNAVRFFKDNKLKGPIFNNYNIGNYLEYRLYPKEKIFIDGNPEQYPKEFFQNVYYPMEGSYSAFAKLSKTYNINAIFYEHKNQTQKTNPVLTELVKSKDWTLVYLDSHIIIFVKNIPQNYNVIKNYALTEKKIKINQADLQDKTKTGDLSNLFRIFAWYKLMMKMDIAYLKFDPHNCTSLRHIVVVMAEEKNPEQAYYLSQYQQYCQK